MSGYPMISSHTTNKEVSKKKLWYPMNYTVTTASHQLYYTWQIIYIYIYVIYTSSHLWSFPIMYYMHSAYPATRSYHMDCCLWANQVYFPACVSVFLCVGANHTCPRFLAGWWCLDALVYSRGYWSPLGWWHSWNFWVEMQYGLGILQERFALLLVSFKSRVPCRLWREGMTWWWSSDLLLWLQMMCAHWRNISWHASVFCIILQFLLPSYFLCCASLCCIQLFLSWTLCIDNLVYFHIVSRFLWWSTCPDCWVACDVWACLIWVWLIVYLLVPCWALSSSMGSYLICLVALVGFGEFLVIVPCSSACLSTSFSSKVLLYS